MKISASWARDVFSAEAVLEPSSGGPSPAGAGGERERGFNGWPECRGSAAQPGLWAGSGTFPVSPAKGEGKARSGPAHFPAGSFPSFFSRSLIRYFPGERGRGMFFSGTTVE